MSGAKDAREQGETMHALIVRADKGDRAALAELKRTLGHADALWRLNGDLAANALASWLDLAYGRAEFSKECQRGHLDEMRRELAGSNPSRLEKLLVERILLAHLAASHADAAYAQRAKDLSVEWASYYQRRCTLAQKRLTDAILALAKVRRLLTPVVQLNVAEKQVNIATVSGPNSAAMIAGRS